MKEKVQCTGEVRLGGLVSRCTNMCNPNSKSAKAGKPLCVAHARAGKHGPAIAVKGQEVRVRDNTEHVYG